MVDYLSKGKTRKGTYEALLRQVENEPNRRVKLRRGVPSMRTNVSAQIRHAFNSFSSHLFPDMRNAVTATRFSSIDDVIATIGNLLDSQEKIFFEMG